MAGTPTPTPGLPAPIPQPLGLPKGSVRATLALLLCATMWYLVIQGRTIPTILIESVLLVVAFYFGTRSMAPPAGPAPASVPGGVAGHEPLYLPRGSVRTVLLVGFFAVIAYIWYRGTTVIPAPMILILQVLTSYLSGFAISTLTIWRARRGGRPLRAVAWLRHGIAAASLAIVAVVCGSIVFTPPSWLPNIPDNFLAWAVAFYFGSRLSP